MVKNNAPLQIRLTEPVIYLRGTSTGADFRGRPQQAREGSSAVVRGLLTLRLSKPTRIRNISIQLEGNARTEWPEGIGPRRTDTYEDHEVINETTTFFSGTEEAKAQTARRSASVGPGLLSQYDLDSDDDDPSSHTAENEWEVRGRPIPRSLSVLPAAPSDWQEWYRDGISRPGSPNGSRTPSRVASPANLAGMRSASHQPLMDDRGPTPAYTPNATTLPISSHPSSILLHRNSRSPMPNGGVSRRTSEQDDPSTPWEGETPLGESQEGLFPLGSPAPNVRFTERGAEETLVARPHDDDDDDDDANRLRRTASSRSEDDAEPVAETEYHPVRDTTFAIPTAHTTPINSPHLRAHGASSSRPPSPHLERTASNNPPDLALPPAGRRQSSLRPTERDTSRRELGQRPGSISVDDASSHASTSLSSPAIHDDRGRAHSHHHRFSLAAALRGLSRDVKDSVRGNSQSRPSSRAGSRANSRTRGAETPRTPHFDSMAEAAPMSRQGSLQNLPALRSGTRSRATSPAGKDRGRAESRGRSRHRLFGKAEEPDEDGVHNWKEFRKGVYNYPISFQIPVNAPPTIHAEFGSVVYRLRATVARVGALVPNLTEEKEVTMIAGPQEDDMEETENVIVERQWEDQMRYQIALSGKAFPIGGMIPISIRLMPLTKCKIFRLTIALEEKTDYFAAGKKVARHETPRRFILFAAKNPDKKDRGEPLLPILSESMSAAKDSPLAPLARQAALNNPREFSDLINPEDDVYASLLDPMGPWHLEKDLFIPDCHSRIKFTTKHESTNMSVQHWLKVTIRVERGDDNAIDSKGRRKQFDIIIETPIKMLECRVNTQYNSLPSYDRVDVESSPIGKGCALHQKLEYSSKSTTGPGSALIGAGVHVLNTITHPGQLYHINHSQHSSPNQTPAYSGAHTPHTGAHTPHGIHTPGTQTPHAAHTSGTHTPHTGASTPPLPALTHGSHAPGHPEHDDTLLERNIVYDRLISGQEAETGEEPPTYKEAVANAIRSARSASCATSSRRVSTSASRSQSRAVSRRSSPVRMYIEE